MSEVLKPTRTLSEALAELDRVAGSAGLDRATARVEGQSLAAAVAESARGAAADWSAETHQPGTQAFFDAASRGRRWRASPTTVLSQLTLEGSSAASAYAQALAGVCAAACGLGEADMRVVGNASVAAAAQLSALRPAAASAAVTGVTGVPEQSDQHTNPVLAALELAQNRLSDLARLGLSRWSLAQQSTIGSSLDLPTDAALTPGAFPGLGTPGSPPAEASSAGSGHQAQSPGQVAPAPPETPALPKKEPEPAPKTLDELLAELDALTGLTEVKAEIHRQVAVLRVERLRTKAGLRSPTITRHLVFVGNPGTGKTTVARLVGGIYRTLGLLSKGQLVEVDRSELVAGYLGQTAIKTAEVVASAVGGVLFIDEAYSLAGDQYGTEAVDTLVKEMEDHRDDLVLIVAGYPDPMAIFVAQNPGLASRFRTTIEFADYTDDELEEIFVQLAQNADYDVTPDCLQRFEMILTTTPRGPTFGNGRFARNHLEAAVGHHAWRLRDIDEPTVAQLRELTADDLDLVTDASEYSGASETPTEPEPPGTVTAAEGNAP